MRHKSMKPGDLVRFAQHRIPYLPADTRWLANNDMIGLVMGEKRVWGRRLNEMPRVLSVLWRGNLHWIYATDLELMNDL